MSEQSPPTPEPGGVPPDTELLGPGDPRGTNQASPTEHDRPDETPAPARGHGGRGDDVPVPREPQAGL